MASTRLMRWWLGAAAAAAAGGGSPHGQGQLWRQQLRLFAIKSTEATAVSPFFRKVDKIPVVLIQDHEPLGRRGDVVHVRPGHARNELYPGRLAVYATPENLQRYGKKQLPDGMTAGGSQAAQELQGTVAGSGQQLSEQDQAAQLALLLELLSTKEVVIGMPPRAPASADDSSTPSTAGGGVSATSATASGSDAASSDSGSGVAAARPIYPVFPGTVSNAVARQLRIHLPKHHVLMPGGPITAYGTYQVPLNLQSADGQRIELRVTVRSRRRL